MKENNEEKNLEIGDVIAKSENFIEKNQKKIIIIASAIVIVVLAFFGLRKWYFEPREVTAAESMFAAENTLAANDYQTALNGNDEMLGFVDIIDQYGCTKAGNLAKYYAAICEMQLGNFSNAIDYLKSYKGKDTFTKIQAVILNGDAELELGNKEAAIKLYEKAVSMDNTNYITAPYALFKAGMVHLQLKNKENAIECFESIKAQYPESTEFSEVDKYLAVAEQM